MNEVMVWHSVQSVICKKSHATRICSRVNETGGTCGVTVVTVMADGLEMPSRTGLLGIGIGIAVGLESVIEFCEEEEEEEEEQLPPPQYPPTPAATPMKIVAITQTTIQIVNVRLDGFSFDSCCCGGSGCHSDCTVFSPLGAISPPTGSCCCALLFLSAILLNWHQHLPFPTCAVRSRFLFSNSVEERYAV